MKTDLGLTKPLASYSHARKAGQTVFLAGQGCRDPETDVWAGVSFDDAGKPVNIDFEMQVRGVFRNIDAVLTKSGLTRSSIVDVQVFLTDLHSQFAVMNKVWNDYFRDIRPLPTRTTIGVKDLPGLNLVEMKVTAFSDEPTS